MSHSHDPSEGVWVAEQPGGCPLISGSQRHRNGIIFLPTAKGALQILYWCQLVSPASGCKKKDTSGTGLWNAEMSILEVLLASTDAMEIDTTPWNPLDPESKWKKILLNGLPYLDNIFLMSSCNKSIFSSQAKVYLTVQESIVHRLSKVQSRSSPGTFCGPWTQTSGPGPEFFGPWVLQCTE